MQPPNYRQGTAKEHCSNCGAFKFTSGTSKGLCRMFNVVVKPDMVCDKWYGRINLRGKPVRI